MVALWVPDLSWWGEELPMWPTLSYLLLNTLHGLLIGKAGDGEAISHNLDDGFAILVDKMSDVERIFLIAGL